jgi:YVTN family beta-propeller protein
MLHAALTALLALQTASGSPNVAPSSPSSPTSPTSPTSGGTSTTNAPSMNPGLPPSSGEPASAQAPPPPSAPTPAPTRTPAPTPGGRRGGPIAAPKASADQLLVVNKTDDSVSILDAASGKLRTTVAVEPGPHEVEMLANHMAAVSSYGRKDSPGRYVSIIDLASGKVVSKIDIGEGSKPHGLKALRDGRLLVTAEGRKELVAVAPREAKVLARYPTGRDLSHLVTASPDGRRAYVTSLTPGSVTVVDLQTGKVAKDIPTGKGAEGLDATPDGREVWVANREANTITVIDVATLAPVFTIRASEFPIRVKIAPDGRTAIATFSGTGDVRVFDTATRVEKGRVAIGRDAVEGSETRVFQKRFGSSPVPVGLLIAPDGRRAFVSAGHADVVAVIDLERMRVDDAWTAGREPDGLAMSVGVVPAPTPSVAPAAPAAKKPPTVRPH